MTSSRIRQLVLRAPFVRRVAGRWYAARLLAKGRTWTDLERAFRLLARDSQGTLIAGPWTGSPSEELLYWIPFLRWAIEAHRIDPERVVAVSPSGAASWYDGLCRTFVADTDARARGVTISATTLLALVEGYRDGRDPLRPVLGHARYRHFERPDTQRHSSPYICVTCAGAAEDVCLAIEEAVGTLRQRVDVVSLDELETSNPTNSIEAISSAISGAGGLLTSVPHFAYLGQLYGVPTIAISDPASQVSQADEELARRIGRGLESPLVILAAPQLRTLLELLPAFAVDPENENHQVVD